VEDWKFVFYRHASGSRGAQIELASQYNIEHVLAVPDDQSMTITGGDQSLKRADKYTYSSCHHSQNFTQASWGSRSFSLTKFPCMPTNS
jgi:hypothetical protein